MRSLCVFVLLLVFSGLNAQKKTSTGGKNKGKEKEKDGDNFFNSHTPRAKDFHSIGHSLFFDFNLGPLKSFEKINTQDTTREYSRLAEYSLYHISYFFRLNLVQPNDDRALTLTLNPGIGLGQVQSKKTKGFGIFTGAVYLGWESGAGSTYRSSEEKGRFIRLGAEYSNMPLFVSTQDKENPDIRSFVNPVLSFGFRKENAKQNLVESNIKIGYGLTKADQTVGTSSFVFYRPFSLRFSLVVFLDH